MIPQRRRTDIVLVPIKFVVGSFPSISRIEKKGGIQCPNRDVHDCRAAAEISFAHDVEVARHVRTHTSTTSRELGWDETEYAC